MLCACRWCRCLWQKPIQNGERYTIQGAKNAWPGRGRHADIPNACAKAKGRRALSWTFGAGTEVERRANHGGQRLAFRGGPTRGRLRDVKARPFKAHLRERAMPRSRSPEVGGRWLAASTATVPNVLLLLRLSSPCAFGPGARRAAPPFERHES